jgi:hypothetical protein
MADQHNDNIPAVGNNIADDIPDIKENLEFHKDVLENFCKGWSNTDATHVFPYVVKDDDEDTMIQCEESADEDTIRFDCAGEEQFTVTDGAIVPTTDNDLDLGDSSHAYKTVYAKALSGEIVNTSQPAFSAYVNAQQNNVTGDGTAYSVTGAIWTEIYDQGNDFSNGTFTAPVTGKYIFNGVIYLLALASAHTYGLVSVVTSNREYYVHHGNYGAMAYTTNGGLIVPFSITADMDASDTAYLTVKVDNGTKVVDMGTTTHAIFTGTLIY